MKYLRPMNLFRLVTACFATCLSTELPAAEKAPGTIAELNGSLIVVLACEDPQAGQVAATLGAGGDSLVHVIAGSPSEAAAINEQVSRADLKGIVSVEEMDLATLPYRDHLVNGIVVMDVEKARSAGLDLEEARRCLAPFGHLAFCKNGELDRLEVMPLPKDMDVWTHRYYGSNGFPVSQDKHFDLPVGFKWNAGLPMNFNNPDRAANRYSSTRAMVVDDGRCFMFSTAVQENLGQSWTSKYGTDQYLTCRDAFNGRFLWRKRIGGNYYGGLYIENTAPLISTGHHLYLAGENSKMLKISTATGETVAELPTQYVPCVIAAADGIIVTATWKQGNVMGSIARYDRRRMDWAITTGTIEAYDDDSGELLWKKDLLGTSLLIAEGRVLLVNRDEKDDLELNHRRNSDGSLNHPLNRLIGLDLKTGETLWTTEADRLGLAKQTLNLESAGFGAVSVATSNRKVVKLVSASMGEILGPESTQIVEPKFFRFRNHICTPAFHVNGLNLANRGGAIFKDGEAVLFGGARSACLTGTIPAYGTGYIAQNWCNCSPGQIPGLLAVASIGKYPTPEEMEKNAKPITYAAFNADSDSGSSASNWSSFRGNASRSSSSPSRIAAEVEEVWSTVVASNLRDGTLQRDWRDYLNSRLTAPVLSAELAILGDIDHNEVIAVRLDNGKVAWRFATAGRMDTSPTLHGGICLIGDHSGYVTALKARTGELLYRLRIAPEEKRMLSYGKIESVWPVIGGVLAANGKAYATAGRTQGSDGGLVVRAFEPETGEAIWARAIPQVGNGVNDAKAKRNDALILEGNLIRLMDHRLDANTGEFKLSPSTARVNAAVAAKEEELGRKLSRKERQEIVKVESPVREGERIRVSLGNEGIYSWNWTRLGNRKFLALGYAGLKGETICWNDSSVGSASSNLLNLTIGGERKAFRLAEGNQGTSLILCDNVLLQGGSLIDQGDKKGFIRAINLENGEIAWEKTYGAQLAFNGLAVDRGEIIASFNDGSVVKLK